MIRAIIIDDEPSAVNVLSMLLNKYCCNDVKIVATSNSPAFGKTLIEEHRPDLVFCDIEMPGMNGIELVRLFPDASFRIVFVTAHDDYAIEAFRLSAIDYLLKPVEGDDIVKVVEKVKKELGKNLHAFQDQLQQLEKILSSKNNFAQQRIGIGMADKIVFVNTSDIIYLEAKGAYTNLHMDNGKKLLASKSLGEFESQLKTSDFFRIHHATIINLNHIREYQRNDGGYVIIANGMKLEVSKRKRKDFLTAIENITV